MMFRQKANYFFHWLFYLFLFHHIHTKNQNHNGNDIIYDGCLFWIHLV